MESQQQEHEKQEQHEQQQPEERAAVPEDYLDAQRAAVEAIEVGRATLEEANRQGEQLSYAEKLADDTKSALEKSSRLLRGMTWSGWVQNMFSKEIIQRSGSSQIEYDEVPPFAQPAAQSIQNYQANLAVLEACETDEQRITCKLVCDDMFRSASQKIEGLSKENNPGVIRQLSFDLQRLRARQNDFIDRCQETGVKGICQKGGIQQIDSDHSALSSVQNDHLNFLAGNLDELSTMACFAVGQPSAPGLSLQFQSELLSNLHSNTIINTLSPPDHRTTTKATKATTKDIDIINTVTKLGRTISYTRTDYRCAESHKLLGYSTHVKYMPTGSWLLDLVFNTKFGFGLYKMLCLPDTTVPEKYPEVSLERSMGGNLEFCDHQDSDNQNQNQNHKGEATFHMNGEHVNPFGSMHGGCHAVLMEMCGEKFIRTLLNNNNNNNTLDIPSSFDIRFRMIPRKATLNSLFVIPVLTRRLAQKRPQMVDLYRKIEFAINNKTKTFPEIKQMVNTLQAAAITEGNAGAAHVRTIVADVAVTCRELFCIKTRTRRKGKRQTNSEIEEQKQKQEGDTNPAKEEEQTIVDIETKYDDDNADNDNDDGGTIVAGSESEQEVVHLVRFEMEANLSNDVLGNWKIIDVDDILGGNVFYQKNNYGNTHDNSGGGGD
mmetsp:Transcript_15088/g.21828  ORF Transcript_15088/g.21828 Transcript_15088/m.21828 type:complete len:660 (+) Transcript_15088:82-2061(+)